VRIVSPETLSASNSDLLIPETNFFIVCSHALPSLPQMTEKRVGLQRISYAVDDRGMGAGFVVLVTDLCVLQTFQTMGPTGPPVQWVTGTIYLWVTQSWCVICVHNTRMPSWRSA